MADWGSRPARRGTQSNGVPQRRNMESSKEGMDDEWTEAVYDLQVLQPRILEQ